MNRRHFAIMRLERHSRDCGGIGNHKQHLWNFSDPPTTLFGFFGPSSGIRFFRLRQDEVIDDLLAGRDAIVLMPTGGESRCVIRCRS